MFEFRQQIYSFLSIIDLSDKIMNLSKTENYNLQFSKEIGQFSYLNIKLKDNKIKLKEKRCSDNKTIDRTQNLKLMYQITKKVILQTYKFNETKNQK